MTIARTVAAIHLAYVRVCAGGFMRKATCICDRHCAYTYTWGLSVRGCAGARVATVELCSNCAKLRISVGDELRDLQYNCTTLSPRVSPHPPPPLPSAVRAAAKELQPRSRYMHTRIYVFTMCAACKRVCMYARTCERTQTNTVTTQRLVVAWVIPIPTRYLRKRIAW